MNDFRIVEASLNDAHAMGQVQKQTWLASYPNPAEGISREDIAAKIKQWEEEGDERIRAEMRKPGAKAWVVKDEEKVIGFIAVLKKDDENSIESLHVLPAYQGKGLGSQLLRTGLDWLGSDKKISIEVVAYNSGAQKLYEKFGFRKVVGSEGDCIVLPSGKAIPKIVMLKELK